MKSAKKTAPKGKTKNASPSKHNRKDKNKTSKRRAKSTSKRAKRPAAKQKQTAGKSEASIAVPGRVSPAEHVEQLLHEAQLRCRAEMLRSLLAVLEWGLRCPSQTQREFSGLYEQLNLLIALVADQSQWLEARASSAKHPEAEPVSVTTLVAVARKVGQLLEPCFQEIDDELIEALNVSPYPGVDLWLSTAGECTGLLEQALRACPESGEPA